MQTITFYSYKGGTGRSLALANAAFYLARLEFKVVVLDFDLEAPGLHYKFSERDIDQPLQVHFGVVDYLHEFKEAGKLPESLCNFVVDVRVPGIDKALLKLFAAGDAPSPEYWSKLAQLDWHKFFYSNDADGVPLFLDLKERIRDELEPDFLLIDSRTGITEMGGIATTLLADKVICLVLPTSENLDGARSVLRSLQRFRRENALDQIEVLTALSRLPSMDEPDEEKKITERVRQFLSEDADDLSDTLSCPEIYVLHRESAIELSESLRIGSGISPDESVLLRDYLRLFATVVPKHLIETKVSGLIQLAKEKMWEDPEAAVKEVEELAESFGHPEPYRALLRFYEIRNISGSLPLKKAQRLWEITRDSNDKLVWETLKRTFPAFDEDIEITLDAWEPDLTFIEDVWREAGKFDPTFGMLLVESLTEADKLSQAADICLQIIEKSGPLVDVVVKAIQLLDGIKRSAEATEVIDQAKPKLISNQEFVEAWAEHALNSREKKALAELAENGSAQETLRRSNPLAAARIYIQLGMLREGREIGDDIIRHIGRSPGRRPNSVSTLIEAGELLNKLGRFEDFEKLLQRYPSRLVEEVRHNLQVRLPGSGQK